MASPVKIETTKTFVFSPPPLGKPNPKEKYLGDRTPDTRSRVVQHALKGECWYYVFNMLRERIGQHPESQALEARKFEKSASKRRKALFQINADLRESENLLSYIIANEVLSTLKLATKEPLVLGKCPSLPLLQSALKQFQEQDHYANFIDFFKWMTYNKAIKINEAFFKEANVDPSIYYRRDCNLDFRIYQLFEGIKWENLPYREKNHLLNSYARQLSQERYGLKISSWRPSQSIDDLIREIDSHGPLYVGGHFGKSFYTVAPFVMDKRIQGREIYAWKPTDPKRIGLTSLHAVLVIGAEKRGSEQHLVYFIDPNDESDPAHLSSQKIYAMSYRKLSTEIIDIGGFQRKIAPKDMGYALYGPRINPSAAEPAEKKENI